MPNIETYLPGRVPGCGLHHGLAHRHPPAIPLHHLIDPRPTDPRAFGVIEAVEGGHGAERMEPVRIPLDHGEQRLLHKVRVV